MLLGSAPSTRMTAFRTPFDPHEAPTLPARVAEPLSPADPLVLVAEASEDSRRTHCESLNRLGYRTVACGRAAGVRELARWHRPDVVLVDLLILARDRQKAPWSMKQEIGDAFVVVMVPLGASSLADAGAVRCDAFVAKPFDAVALERLLAEVRAKKGREIVKRCGCGRVWSRDEWKQLPLCGTMRGVELRNCACGSSLAVWSTTSGRAANAAPSDRIRLP
jgi:CheY-like chemotaxis protein